MPETIAAAEVLAAAGVNAGVVCLTSPDLVFRSFQQRGRRDIGDGGSILDELFPTQHPAPLVTVLDGQSSDLDDAYRLHRIDTGSIADAALSLLGR